RHSLWLAVFAAAVDHSMPDAAHGTKTDLPLDPVNDQRASRSMVGRLNRQVFACLARNIRLKSGIGQSNALEFAREQASRRCLGAVKGKLDARGATVNCEDTGLHHSNRNPSVC